ncbi:MAG: cyclic nucleotide-binding protein [Hyphomicrobiales bacterium]|nr:MAG: cyclic nucleotide-binding protein [Hyphomicrobiales bacterium]
MSATRYARVKHRVFEVLEEGAAGDLTSKLVDRSLIALIVINLISVALETVPEYSAKHHKLFLAVEIFSVILFSLEYAARVWVADEFTTLRHLRPSLARLRYMVSPWAVIDLLAIMPFFIGFLFPVTDLRMLRVFRLVRFLKLVRYSIGIRSLASAIESEKRALLGSLVIILGVVLMAASVIHIVEHQAQPEKFGSIPASMWWAIATLTTVGYGDVVPITASGKFIAGVVMLLGYGMFALPIGIVATAFAREIHQRDFVVTWGMVARVPLFAQMSASEIAEVMKLLRAQIVERGAIIARRGEPARSMYFIASGRVQIDLRDASYELGDGAFFGEIAVLKHTERSGNVTALSRSTLLALDADDLHILMTRNQTIGAHIRSVARSRLGSEIVTPGGDLVEEELEQTPPDPERPDGV